MTIGSILRQIQTMAGDPDGRKSSMEFLLSAFSDEMRFCCTMFPQQIGITSIPLTGNSPTTATLLDNIIVKYVWNGDTQCQKIYASDMLAILNSNQTASQYYWCMDNNVLTVSPAGGTVRVVGDLYPKVDYVATQLDNILSVASAASGTSPTYRPGLIGGELAVVRYRTAQRLAEFIGDFQRAQYFLQVSVRKEAEIRSTRDERSTVSLGGFSNTQTQRDF